MSQRKEFGRLPDSELAQRYRDGVQIDQTAQAKYASEGSITQELADQHADARLDITIAKAVARRRTISGDGHYDIPDSIRASGKDLGQHFGAKLRDKRENY